MPGLRDIKRRLLTVRNIRKITYAMKLVATAKLKKAQEAVVNTREYTVALGHMLYELKEAAAGGLTHLLLDERTAIRNIAVVVVGGSRGLCGGYNTNVNKGLEKFLQEQRRLDPSAGHTFYVIGKKPAEYFRRVKREYRQAYEGLPEDPYLWPLDEITAELERAFLAGECDEVYVLYTRFKSAISMHVTTQILLPLEEQEADENKPKGPGDGDIIFEPSPQRVFDLVVPKIFRARLLQACLDAKAGEHGSRMTAMDSATKNGDELMLKLELLHNKMRQTGITGELLDIIGGSNAEA